MIKTVKSIPYRTFTCRDRSDLTPEIVREGYKKAKIDILTKLGCIPVSDRNQAWSEEYDPIGDQMMIVVRYSDNNSQEDKFEMFKEQFQNPE